MSGKVSGTVCLNSLYSGIPCAGCGAIGEQVWLLESDHKCAMCRGYGDSVKELAIVKAEVIEGQLEAERAKGHVEALEEMRQGAALFVIETQEDLETASEIVNEISARLKTLEAEEKAATKPILEGVARVRSWFAPARKTGEEALGAWKRLILKSNEERRLKAAEAAAKVQIAIAAGDSRTAAVLHRQVQPPEPVKGLQSRKVWAFKVVNQGLLTAEYLVPNENAIRAEMRAQIAKGQEPVIPGVKFEQVESLAATGT